MHEIYAIVPNIQGTALLVLDGRLPLIRGEERVPQPELLARLAAELGIHATFLRTVRWQDEDGNRITLCELADGTAPAGSDWLALDTVEPADVAPVFADGLAEWLEERRTGIVPPQRSPWARPGWLAQAAAWVEEVAPGAGRPTLVRQWPLSAMYAFGDLYLKACYAIWPHEPAITALLAREHPGRVPEVVATDDERSWLLMRRLEGPDVADASPARYEEELRTFAELQRSWVGRADELPIPRRALAQISEALPELTALCRRLEAFDIPETLTHGDLHQWNAVIEHDRVVIIDWSDAAVAHPFIDLGAALFYSDETHDRERLINAYLEPWGGEALREAAAIGEALGCAYQAISFRAIVAALEPGDPLFANEWERWSGRATALAAAL